VESVIDCEGHAFLGFLEIQTTIGHFRKDFKDSHHSGHCNRSDNALKSPSPNSVILFVLQAAGEEAIKCGQSA
jgi:hypothetical protein